MRVPGALEASSVVTMVEISDRTERGMRDRWLADMVIDLLALLAYE